MIRTSIDPERVVQLLNEMLKLDQEAVYSLFGFRTPCNDSIANHESIQVSDETPSASVGFLGILNGLFGVDEHGIGPICMVMQLTEIIEFTITPGIK